MTTHSSPVATYSTCKRTGISINLFSEGAAYSEHSSFSELKDFITKLKPMKVQPTVFGGAAKEAGRHIDGWLRSDETINTSLDKP